MKKFFKMLAVAAMVACGFMMTSCSEDEVNALLGPDNTWCETSLDTNNDGTKDVFVAAIYCPSSITGTMTAAPYLKKGTTLEAGITVVAYSTVTYAPLGLSANTYAVKSFPKDSETTVKDADGTTTSLSGSKAKFAVMYRAKSDFRETINQYPCTAGTSELAPAPLTNNPGTYIPLGTEALANFNWKTLLANYLLK